MPPAWSRPRPAAASASPSGRRAAQAIADHLLHLGPAPETVLARELPRFALKRLMRLGLDAALPNMLVDAAIATPPMRWLAAHIYFHRRSPQGISFAEFEARLAASAGANRGCVAVGHK